MSHHKHAVPNIYARIRREKKEGQRRVDRFEAGRWSGLGDPARRKAVLLMHRPVELWIEPEAHNMLMDAQHNDPVSMYDDVYASAFDPAVSSNATEEQKHEAQLAKRRERDRARRAAKKAGEC